ncbi:hypothetical protein FBQ87_07070 [Sphingobacteriales bacterium CHB3]|nr:hypothetical protein [Sphingobacteriales bacterium CHB3]
MTKRSRRKNHLTEEGVPRNGNAIKILIAVGALLLVAAIVYLSKEGGKTTPAQPAPAISQQYKPTEIWLQRAYAIGRLFHRVYTPGWEGAYGAIGDAFLFAVTRDSALLRYHIVQRNLTRLDNGYWVDDRAWAALAELKWWDVTGKINTPLVTNAAKRYDGARKEGRLSNHEGFWTWYNWPPTARVNEPIFTNSNMNQMVTVACLLFNATGEQRYLDDALLVWNGDGQTPGVEKTLYKGNGRWEGRPGRAAFGKELPWHGTGYCAVAAALYRATNDEKFRTIAVATARHIMSPEANWVDQTDFYQTHMDGNGAFVNFLLEAYLIAHDQLADLPGKIERMLDHVWTNGHGKATVTLHRESDSGIRNGWNLHGGEDGYKVGDIGTVHAQAEALRAFGSFAFVKYGFANQ